MLRLATVAGMDFRANKNALGNGLAFFCQQRELKDMLQISGNNHICQLLCCHVPCTATATAGSCNSEVIVIATEYQQLCAMARSVLRFPGTFTAPPGETTTPRVRFASVPSNHIVRSASGPRPLPLAPVDSASRGWCFGGRQRAWRTPLFLVKSPPPG
eukprot:gene14670-biopygen15689